MVLFGLGTVLLVIFLVKPKTMHFYLLHANSCYFSVGFVCFVYIQVSFLVEPYMYITKYIYIKSTTVYVPSSKLGLSRPLSRQRVCPSRRYQRGAHSPAYEGLGESQFRRLEKKLSTLPTLWCTYTERGVLLVPTAHYTTRQLRKMCAIFF